jgi:IS1 family transposase
MASSNTAIEKGGTNQTFKGRRQNFKKQKIESKNLVLRRHFIRKKKKTINFKDNFKILKGY